MPQTLHSSQQQVLTGNPLTRGLCVQCSVRASGWPQGTQGEDEKGHGKMLAQQMGLPHPRALALQAQGRKAVGGST